MNSVNNFCKQDEYSVTIVGGGLGGLAAGAKLALAGRKVLVIEQNAVVGGFARLISSNDFTHEFSLHQLFGFEKENPLRDIFEEFGIFSKVEFVKLPNFYRCVIGKADVILPHDLQGAAAVLARHFPQEAKGIRIFFDTITALNREVNQWIKKGCSFRLSYPFYPLPYPYMAKYSNTTVGNFLNTIIEDEELKIVLVALMAWYHDDPYSTSLVAFAFGHASCFAGGGYYVKGGSQKLSDELAKIITGSGGSILLNHRVTAINTRGKKVCGVTYQDKTTGVERKTFTKYVVANAALPRVASDLLSGSARHSLFKQIKGKRPSISFLSVHLKFKKPLSAIGNKSYCTVIGHKCWTSITQFAEACRINNYAVTGLSFTDYSIIDNGLPRESRYSGVLVVVDSLDHWQPLSPAQQETKKQEAFDLLTARLESILPGVMREVETYDVITPMTFFRETCNPAGTPYGFAQIPRQMGLGRVGNISPVGGLYFASAWSRPGGGCISVICAGYNCARYILEKPV